MRASSTNARREARLGGADNRFDNLIQRYEEPNSMVRWDSPLFTIPWDEELPGEDIWIACTSGNKKPPTQAAAVVSRRQTAR